MVLLGLPGGFELEMVLLGTVLFEVNPKSWTFY